MLTKCPVCGHEVSSTVMKCPNCGASPINTEDPEVRKQLKLNVVSALGGVLFWLGLTLLAILFLISILR